MANEINKQFHDPRLARDSRPKSDRERDAFEFLVREGMNTAKQFGREVSEDEVRKQIRAIVEPADAKAAQNGYKNPDAGKTPKQAKDSHDFIDENPNLKEI